METQNAVTNLSLGYSTCPNDTFVFHALVHGLVHGRKFSFDVSLKDIESLNQDARRHVLDISKLSFGALGHLQQSYGLLRSGAALGRGCGPLIVARPGKSMTGSRVHPVAVPGLWTTAHLLTGLYLDARFQPEPMTFDRIMPAVAEGRIDFGVIIHEGRFTFERYGLECLVDLGRWWEDETGLPIPLGCIAVKRDITRDTARQIDRAIRDSVTYAFKHPNASEAYVKDHAQEMDDEVIRQHIELYVNDFSVEMGKEGEAATNALFDRARRKGLMPRAAAPLFAY